MIPRHRKMSAGIDLSLSLPTALKKPAITQNHIEGPEAGVGAGAGAGEGAGPGLSLDQPVLQDKVPLQQQDKVPLQQQQQQLPQAVADRPVLFDEDIKAAIKADEFGEQQRQLIGMSTRNLAHD